MNFRLLPVAVTLLVTQGPVSALVIRTFDPAVHFRITGFTATPQINPTFLNAGGNPATLLNLTGVGWDSQNTDRQLTLVSPRHFVGANHYRPAVGSQVVLLAPGNTVHSFTIASISNVPNDDNSPSDLYLGELTQNVPTNSNIRPLPYLNLSSEAEFTGKSLVVLGKTARGGRGSIASVSDFGGDPITAGAGIKTRAFTFTYNTLLGQNDDAHCEVGDSGSPSFVILSGKPALVGTHTAVLAASGTVTTYDTLVPHYAPVLNTLMEPDGYHMIKATPPATTFTTSGGAPSTAVRALKPFALPVTLTNGSAIAENINASFSPAPATASATDWIDGETGSLRRGGMTAGAASAFSLTFAGIPQSGSTMVSMTVSSDGSPSQVFQFPINVLPSYAEWAAGLTDQSPGGDPDFDNIPNLLEYAFGGGPQESARTLPGNPAQPILPVLTNPNTLTFLRRADDAARGLSYILESSDTLAPGTWQEVASPVMSNVSQPAAGMEKVTVSLPSPAGPKRFFRIRVELAE